MNRSVLQNVYLFKSFTNSELDAVSEIAKTQTYAPGETIFIRGEAAQAMYFIKFGSVRVQQSAKSGDALDVATLSAGSHLGEMAFVDGEPRSATAVAAERTEVVIVPYENLRAYLKKNAEVAVKFYRELAHFLCGRLRVTTSDLSFAKEKNISHF